MRQLRGASCGDWEGVERPWRRSHGANLNPATAVFPAVPVLAKHLHVSVRSTATTAAMEAASRCCACHCDIAARRPQETVRQGRSHGSGNQARDGRRKAGNYGCRRASESRTCGGRSGSRSRWRLGRVLVYSRTVREGCHPKPEGVEIPAAAASERLFSHAGNTRRKRGR